MKVVTAVVNNPIFIQIQYYTLKQHMKCDYEFIVFNDAKTFPDYSNGGDIRIKNNIEEICQKLGIICINIPNNHHKKNIDASSRTADSLNFILAFQKQYPDKYLLLDSDMFLIDDFSLSDYENYDCSVVLQSRNKGTINYIWNGLYYFDINRTKNLDLLNWNCLPGCDTGGMTQQWLKIQVKNKEKIHFIKHLCSGSWNASEFPDNLKNNKKLFDFINSDPRNKNGQFYCEIYDNKFLHYRAGGNWEKKNMKLHVDLSFKLRQMLLE
jgi:hypothetical protein